MQSQDGLDCVSASQQWRHNSNAAQKSRTRPESPREEGTLGEHEEEQRGIWNVLVNHGAQKKRRRQRLLHLHPIVAKNKQDRCKATESHSGRYSCCLLHFGAEGGGNMVAWDMEVSWLYIKVSSFSLASWPVGKGRVLSEKGILQWTM